MLNVVIINGGRGASRQIPKLLDKYHVNLTSIVNAYDDFKSTGEIRKFFSMLGPSDIRKVQQLMLPSNDKNFPSYQRLFNHRFPEGIKRNIFFKEISNYLNNHNSALVGEKIESEFVNGHLKQFLKKF